MGAFTDGAAVPDSDQRLPMLTFRVPRPMSNALRGYARRTGSSVSAAMRELLIRALTEHGMWPPPVDVPHAR